MTPKFPHFIRKITAGAGGRLGNYLFWYLILIIILANLFYPFTCTPDSAKNLKQEIMRNPLESSLHERLGELYLAINGKAAAKEYTLAEELYRETSDGRVLGVSASPLAHLAAFTTARQKMEKERDHWISIDKSFPDYLYAKAKIAALSYQLGDRNKSKTNLDFLLSESPSDPFIVKLSEELR